MKTKTFLAAALVTITVALVIGFNWTRSESATRALWQRVVAPGPLSQSHAFLSNQCSACHTPVKGVEAALCISCHADNTALLQRQPTAFHANVQTCTGCHLEHQGAPRMPTTMDHSMLAKIGHRQIKAAEISGGLNAADIGAAAKMFDRVELHQAQAPHKTVGSAAVNAASRGGLPANHPLLSGADESKLNCASCHASKDRHRGLFGADCVQCHATTQWTVSQFAHPSARSTECAQCHRPPPSHNMMHFSMMSVPLARQPNAKVNQCFMCHQTTSWNDIKGVGMVKHH